jgi:hypothetical protein
MDKLSKVRSFVGQNFFPSELDSKRLVLQPRLKYSDEEELRKRYDDYAAELNDLTTAAWTAYRQYRATVRKRLKI